MYFRNSLLRRAVLSHRSFRGTLLLHLIVSGALTALGAQAYASNPGAGWIVFWFAWIYSAWAVIDLFLLHTVQRMTALQQAQRNAPRVRETPGDVRWVMVENVTNPDGKSGYRVSLVVTTYRHIVLGVTEDEAQANRLAETTASVAGITVLRQDQSALRPTSTGRWN